jgi:hypothetical protein
LLLFNFMLAKIAPAASKSKSKKIIKYKFENLKRRLKREGFLGGVLSLLLVLPLSSSWSSEGVFTTDSCSDPLGSVGLMILEESSRESSDFLLSSAITYYLSIGCSNKSVNTLLRYR